MTIEMTGLCRDHSFEPAADLCRMCGAEFCEGCLVYPFRKPLCKTCAIAAAGVRAAGSPKPLKKADIRKRLKAFEEAQEARRSSDAPALMPTKPLSSYDLIGQTAGRDPDGPAETDGTGDPELASPATAELVGSAGEGASVSESPGGDVAPPVDWNNPFG